MKRFLVLLSFVPLLGCVGMRPSYLHLLQDVGSSFPDVNAVYVFDSTSIEVEEDGRYLKRIHVVLKILTEQGIRKFARSSFGYMESHGRLRLKGAYVVTPLGKRIKVPKENVKEISLPAFEGSKFFVPNIRFVTVIYPGLEKGSSIEYEIEERVFNPPLKDNFNFRTLFERREPIREKHVIVRLPEEMDLKYLVKNGELRFEKVRQGKRVVYHWWDSNIKGIEEEPAMPPFEEVGKELLLTTVNSWREWSRWYYNLSKSSLITDSTLDLLVDSLIKGSKSREDSMRALFYFVSQKIRSVETTLTGKKAGYEPKRAPFTLKMGYGVCRDKAALLVAMLRRIGIDAYMALTNPLLRIEARIPVDQFNHTIVAVRTREGYTYLDPTAENTREFLPAYEEGKAVLISDSLGQDLLFVPYSKPSSNSFRFLIEKELSGDTLRGVLTLSAAGYLDSEMRNIFEKLNPEQRRMVFQEMLKGVVEDAILDSTETSDYKDYSVPLTIRMFFHSEEWGELKRGTIRLPSMNIRGLGMGFDGAKANLFALERRRYPIYLGMVMEIRKEVSLKIPRGLEVLSMPPLKSLDNEYLSWSSSYGAEGGRLFHRSVLSIKNPYIPPELYEELKNMMEEIEAYSKRWILLRKRSA